MTFIHLNVRTDRSIMLGMIKPAWMAVWAKMNGVGAVSVADNGNLSAAVELYSACKKHDLKPIYGMRANVVPNKTEKKQGGRTLLLFAKNEEGFKNLLKLATTGAMYFYYMPRIDLTDLMRYGRGLIVLTSDVASGVASEQFFIDKSDGLRRVFDRYTPIFGDDFYFELQPNPTESQRIFNEGLVEFKEDNPSANLVMTSECYYQMKNDIDLHEMLLAAKNSRNPGWQYPFKGAHHVKSRKEIEEELSDLHGYDVTVTPAFAESLETPQRIVDKIENFDLRSGIKIPQYIA